MNGIFYLITVCAIVALAVYGAKLNEKKETLSNGGNNGGEGENNSPASKNEIMNSK